MHLLAPCQGPLTSITLHVGGVRCGIAACTAGASARILHPANRPQTAMKAPACCLPPQVKDYVARFARPEDVAALEEAEKHGGGAEGMSEDGESGEHQGSRGRALLLQKARKHGSGPLPPPCSAAASRSGSHQPACP